MPETSLRYLILGDPTTGKNRMQIRRNRKTGKPFISTSDKAKAWQLEAISQLAEQRLRSRHDTMMGTVCVEYVVYQTTDKIDIDNIEAALFDALKKARVIDDDKHIWDHRGTKRFDDQPRIELTITPYCAPLGAGDD